MNPETTSIDALELSIRPRYCLRNNNCKTVADVTRMTERELLRLPNFGRQSLREVREALSDVGLALTPEIGPNTEPQEVRWMRRIDERLTIVEKHLREMRSALIEVLEYDLKSGHLRITKSHD